MALLKKMGGRRESPAEPPPDGEPGTVRLEEKPAVPGTRQVKPEEAPAPAPMTRPMDASALAGGPGAPAKAEEVPLSPPLSVGATLEERYQIESVLGIGGMSVVYKGRDLRFKGVYRTCAIKEMIDRSPNSQTRGITLKNFEREASLLATLNHPAIPKIDDY